MSKNDVGSQMAAILDSVRDTIENVSDKDFKKAAQSARKKCMAYASSNQGKYRKGFATKKISDNGYVTYNKTKPGLTHLLNNGHMVRNRNGTYGRYNGDNHMGRAEAEAVSECLKDLMSDLNREL